jgi:hypothetical protein
LYKQYLKVAPSKTGSGVFTSVRIPAKSPVIEVTGDLFTSATADHNHPALLQIGSDTYLGPSGDVDDYVNHSCNPNCFLHVVGNRAILFSLYDIPIGSEITFDYSTTSTDSLEQWKMECQCGDFNCRKIISGFHYLPPTLVEEYKKNGIIPLFMKDPIFMKKF